MTDIDLDAIEARANAATDGPWSVYQTMHAEPKVVNSTGHWPAGEVANVSNSPADYGNADAEFIAHARTDVPALVAEVRRLREDNARMARDLAEYRSPMDDGTNVRHDPSATTTQPGADADGFGGDAPEPYDGPRLVAQTSTGAERPPVDSLSDRRERPLSRPGAARPVRDHRGRCVVTDDHFTESWQRYADLLDAESTEGAS